MKLKRFASAVLAGALALSLAACGGAASTSTAASASSAAGSASASAAADGSDLDYIKGKGKLVIGYTVYEPMNYTDADGMANTATTKAYAKNAQVVVVKDGTDYTSTADLVGKTVVAEAGSAGETAIAEDENLAQADYVSKGVQTDCLLEVAAGTADAAVLDLTLANAMIGEGTDYADLKIVDELNAEEYGVAFRKGSDAAAAVNAAFDELKADGTLQALADKYDLALAD